MKLKVAVALLAVVVAVRPVVGEDKPKAGASAAAKPATTLAAAATNDSNAVVARVGADKITRKELDLAMQGMQVQLQRRGGSVPPAMMRQFEYDMLGELVNRQLMLQEGRAHPPADADEKVKKQWDAIKARFGGEEPTLKALAETGVTQEEYTQRLRNEIIIQSAIDQLIEREVKIKPEETKDFYDKNPDKFKAPEMVRASHILILVPQNSSEQTKKDKRAQIDAARSLVKSGEPFADIAKKVSEDPGTAPRGGDLGFFGRGQMVPEFDAAAFSLKTNQLSEVITTQYGYHVLMVTDHKPAGQQPFADVKDDIEKYLRTSKGRDVAQQHVKDLREKTKVELLLPEPPPQSLPTSPATAAPSSSKPLPSVETAPVAAPTKK